MLFVVYGAFVVCFLLCYYTKKDAPLVRDVLFLALFNCVKISLFLTECVCQHHQFREFPHGG